MSTRPHTLILTPPQVAIVVEALGVCLNSDTFLDNPVTLGEAEALLSTLEALP